MVKKKKKRWTFTDISKLPLEEQLAYEKSQHKMTTKKYREMVIKAGDLEVIKTYWAEVHFLTVEAILERISNDGLSGHTRLQCKQLAYKVTNEFMDTHKNTDWRRANCFDTIKKFIKENIRN